MARTAEIPDLRIRAILTDDFLGVVSGVLSMEDGAEFSAQRLGGRAVAKTILRRRGLQRCMRHRRFRQLGS